MIDGVVRILFPNLPFDKDGAIASQGHIDEYAFELLRHYFKTREFEGETMGREDFHDNWVMRFVRSAPKHLLPADIVASVVDAVARQIGEFAQRGYHVMAGGGARNSFLIDRIRHHSGEKSEIVLSDELGIPCEAREAVCFAVLGALSQDGVAITLPQVTRSEKPGTAGAWVYP